jgi:hypothetical protein
MTKLIVGGKSDKPDTLVLIDRFAVGALTSIEVPHVTLSVLILITFLRARSNQIPQEI